MPLIMIDQPSRVPSLAPTPRRRGRPRKSSIVVTNDPSPPILAPTKSGLISSRTRSKCHSDTFSAKGEIEGVIGYADNVPPVVQDQPEAEVVTEITQDNDDGWIVVVRKRPKRQPLKPLPPVWAAEQTKGFEQTDQDLRQEDTSPLVRFRFPAESLEELLQRGVSRSQQRHLEFRAQRAEHQQGQWVEQYHELSPPPPEADRCTQF